MLLLMNFECNFFQPSQSIEWRLRFRLVPGVGSCLWTWKAIRLSKQMGALWNYRMIENRWQQEEYGCISVMINDKLTVMVMMVVVMMVVVMMVVGDSMIPE